MIIWIASYPKSGNTWVRFFLKSYFNNYYSNITLAPKIYDNFKIQNFPNIFFMKERNVNYLNFQEIVKNWKNMQDYINLNNKTNFLKTHNALCTIKNYPFTTSENTSGGIYVVRDPRDVVISASEYYGISKDKMISTLINPKFFNYSLTNPKNIDFISSWKFHFHSWRKLDGIPYLIIKYEDMIKDINKTFMMVMNFLADLINFKVNYNQIEFSINSSSFDVLKKTETELKYKEINDGKPFFRSGETSQWKNKLNKTQLEIFENEFEEELCLLEYI